MRYYIIIIAILGIYGCSVKVSGLPVLENGQTVKTTLLCSGVRVPVTAKNTGTNVEFKTDDGYIIAGALSHCSIMSK